MAETLQAEVIHVVPPEKLDEHDVDPDLEALADGRYVLVCRAGGAPSWFDRVRSFLLREPIEPVTVVTGTEYSEGEEFGASVRETRIAGVYETIGDR